MTKEQPFRLEWPAAYRRRENLASRKIIGETLVVPVSGQLADFQRVFAMEGVGDLVWDLLDGSRSLEKIGRTVLDRYDADEATIRADLSEFVTELARNGLIEKVMTDE